MQASKTEDWISCSWSFNRAYAGIGIADFVRIVPAENQQLGCIFIGPVNRLYDSLRSRFDLELQNQKDGRIRSCR
jgi:hypothetical protein